MLSLRKAQVQLQSHRIWLDTFRAGRLLSLRNTSRSFTSTAYHGQELKIRRVVGSQGLSDAKRRKQERWEGRRTNKTNTFHLGALSIRHDLLQAVKDQNTKDIIRLYNQLPEKRPLGEGDFRSIAQWMHQALRLENQKRERKEQTVGKDTEEIVAFTRLLVNDIRTGNIVPSRAGHLHMMAIFKESGSYDAGKYFWAWLEKQDASHVGHEIYAAAIELLAVSGTPLNDLEEMYKHCLARFPGDFHSYHLSPNAIIPDRDQHPPIRGLPLGLLQAIMTARLLRGNSRDAYLALDTAIRLFPTTASLRFFNLYLDERPVSEAYTVFAMACRAGYKVPNKGYRKLVDNLRESSDFTSVRSHITSLRAILSTLYLYMSTTGVLLTNPVSSFVITLAESFRLPGTKELESKQRKKLVDVILKISRKVFEVFARHGVLPQQQSFNSIIFNLAGAGRSKEVLGIVMKDLQALGMEPNDITRRSVLSVAGRWQDHDMIEKTWDELLNAKRERGLWPDMIDFSVLIKSTRYAGNLTFAEKQFQTLQMFMPEYQRIATEKKLVEPEAVPNHENDAQAIDFDELVSGLARVEADIDAIETQTRDQAVVHDFSSQSFPMNLLDPAKLGLSASEDDLRKIYDGISTAAPQTAHSESNVFTEERVDLEPADIVKAPREPVRSSTNIPFGELRYQNWKSVNYLLKVSELHDAEYDQMVDEAIAAGTRPPPRGKTFFYCDLEMMSGDVGLSGVEGKARAKKGKVEDVKREILRLRGLGGS